MDAKLCYLRLVLYLMYLLNLVFLSSADITEKKLIHDLMTNYDKRARPSSRPGQALNVTFGLALSQLIDVDEKNQIITTNCWLNQAWLDNDLQWDPKNYGGVDTILLPHTEVWLPDILLYNNADTASTKSSTVSTNVIVTHAGNVTWLSMVIYKSSCTIDVTYFPFDEQFCDMVFASWTYDGSQLNLTLVDEVGDLSNYLPSSEFDLATLKVVRNVVFYSCCVHPYPDITYTIHFRRRPSFYVFNLLMPCFLITLVALLGFWIPPESGEKVQMGITTLMAMTVFLMIVTEQMPPTSDSLPLIGIYYFITIGIVSFATAMTVFTLNIHHMGKHGRVVPRWLEHLAFRILAPMLCLKLELPESYKLKEQTTPGSIQSPSRKSPAKGKLLKDDSEKVELLKNGGILRSTNGNTVSPNDSPIRPHHGSSAETSFSEEYPSALKTPSFTEHNLIRILRKLTDFQHYNNNRMRDIERKSEVQQEWQQVSIVLDRLLLIIFVVLTVSVTSGMMIKGYFINSGK